MTPRRLRVWLAPLILLGAGTPSRCELSTASGTGELRLVGIIRFLGTDGGCWQLEAETGRRYELRSAQAPASLLRDGTRVSLVGQPAEDADTGCRVGLPIDVRRVLSVEPGD
jgi:hypothetical protein